MGAFLMAGNKIPPRIIPPPAHERTRDIDLSILSEAKRKEITEKAKTKVAARLLMEAEDELLRQEMKRLEIEQHPEIEEERREIRIDLAAYADKVLLDGRAYFHGELYDVTKSVYDVLRECESRTARHDEEIHGNEQDTMYRRSRQYSMSFRTGATSSGGVPIRV